MRGSVFRELHEKQAILIVMINWWPFDGSMRVGTNDGNEAASVVSPHPQRTTAL